MKNKKTKTIKDDEELKEISGTELLDDDLENVSGGVVIFKPEDYFLCTKLITELKQYESKARCGPIKVQSV